MTIARLPTKKNMRLDAYERDILASDAAGLLKPVDNLEEEMAFAKEAAKNTLERLAKDAHITLRLPKDDLQKLKERAHDTGLPYQTLIGMIVRQYVSGKIEVKV